MIVLTDKSNNPLYLQIYQQIKEKIISGQIAEDARLPSIRTLSDTLDVSKNTVIYAYEQLCSEGYVVNKTRSGFYTQKLNNEFFNLKNQNGFEQRILPLKSNDDERQHHTWSFNFQYGKLNPRDFPINLWRKLSNQLLSPVNLGKIVSYPDRKGEPGLREAIMKYLNISRGVCCRSEQIVICSGTQTCLTLLCQLLKKDHSHMAIEDPGYDGARVVFINNGMNLIPIGLDKGGIRLDELEKSHAKLVYTTPSRQFPTGVVMPIQKRVKLLDWAARNSAVIIEDDYDSELRYKGRPIPSIQSIDARGRVVYVGTFSKSLSPALRLSYMVIPESMMETYTRAFEKYNIFVPWLEQKIVGAFMEAGHWERHLRKVRLANRKRHDVLIQTLDETMGDKVVVHGKNAGLHVILEFKNGLFEEELIKKANDHGVMVYPVSRYWIRRELYANNMILLGFSGMDEHRIVEGVRILNRAWFNA